MVHSGSGSRAKFFISVGEIFRKMGREDRADVVELDLATWCNLGYIQPVVIVGST